MYSWNPNPGEWVVIGGSLDTAKNEITAPISDVGIYAAFTTNIATDIGESGSTLPNKVELYANYPNPFNAATRIQFSLPQQANVRIDVINLLGQLVTRLADRKYPAGAHSVEWNGTDSRGQTVASGVYFYRLTTGTDVLVKKMLLLK